MGERLPKGWKLKALRDCIEAIASGVSVNGEDTPASPADKGVLKVSAVSVGQFMPTENKKIVRKDLARARLNPRAGCLLMSRANTPELVGGSPLLNVISKTCFYRTSFGRSVCRQAVPSLRSGLQQCFPATRIESCSWSLRLVVAAACETFRKKIFLNLKFHCRQLTSSAASWRC